MRADDRGSIANAGTALRDLIRGEAKKQARVQDQVTMGVVTDVGNGVDVEVLVDGFTAGPIAATWMTPVTAALDQRVTLVGLTGGQTWMVIGVNGGTVSAVPDGAEGEGLIWESGAWNARDLVETDISDLGHYTTSDFATDFAAESLVNLATRGITNLSDVTITSVGADEILGYSSGWINRTLAEAGIAAASHGSHNQDHGTLTGLGDVADHLLYLDLAGTRAMTGSLDVGGNTLLAPLDPSVGTHVGDRDYNDARYILDTVLVDWTSYSPSYTNMSIGNGSVNARYFQMGKLVVVEFYFTLGSTSTITGSIRFSLPKTVSTKYNTVSFEWDFPGSAVKLREAGGGVHPGTGYIADGTSDFTVECFDVTGATFLATTNTSATKPFTWGTGDWMGVHVEYEAA